MLERDFQRNLVKELKSRYPGCFVLKMDGSNVPQGFPDLLILYKNKWAALECKQKRKAKRENNQDDYVDILNDMSYSSFIFPENKEDVLYDLDTTFGT